MKYIVYTADKADSLTLRQANRDAHLAFLRDPEAPVKLLTAGPWLDDEGVMRGSMLIVEADDKETVEDWLAGDPYRQAGLTQKTMIRAYIWAIGAPE